MSRARERIRGRRVEAWPSEKGGDYSAEIERAAEYAVLLAMGSLRSRGLPLTVETVPVEAADRLRQSKPAVLAQLTQKQARAFIDKAVAKMEASGRIFAPRQPSIFWRRLRG